MYELTKRFIGKKCLLTLLEGYATGVISEVTEKGIVFEDGKVINLDYVITITSLKVREKKVKNKDVEKKNELSLDK